ncbi:MAG: phosphatase PAP2 family protein [Planctomycetes bacterium]|nr:phosphatase PAP2 family protein [Planctomycetota bacterium]
MAGAACRLAWVPCAAVLALSLPACVPSQFVPFRSQTDESVPAPPHPAVLPSGERQPSAAPQQGANVLRVPTPEALEERTPGFWDRLGVDVDLARDDFRQFYSPTVLGELGLGIGAAAPLANTSADRTIRRWYQERIKREWLNPVSTVASIGGQAWMAWPLWMEFRALQGKAGEDYYLDGGLYEWGNRSLRAVATGYPPVLALYGLLGASRPSANDSRWHPFQDFHGVSGHTFLGAVPFLTAAQMIEEPMYKVPLVLGSFLTGWSRIHDDRHYFSQVALGWWIAYLSVSSVDRTQEERAVTLTPFTADGPGLGVEVRY